VLPVSLLPLVRVGNVTYRRIVDPEIRRTICAVTLKSRSLSPSAAAFLELCVSVSRNRQGAGAHGRSGSRGVK
jgi:hypothetical protein